jgi:hypothetical protein
LFPSPPALPTPAEFFLFVRHAIGTLAGKAIVDAISIRGRKIMKLKFCSLGFRR